MEMLKAKWAKGLFVCVGLDSEYRKIPVAALDGNVLDTIIKFNRAIVNATLDHICACKPNLAFYAAQGDAGLLALRDTITYIHEAAPSVPVILDAKVADIGNTNAGYVELAFDFLDADAITVHPYLGQEALKPFLDRKDKGIIVLCRTSNPGAGEFQDLQVANPIAGKDVSRAGEDVGPVFAPTMVPLYQRVAYNVANEWNKNGNCAVVVGATYPDELREVRKIIGDMPALIPGIGVQGGDLEKTVAAGKDSKGQGMIINSSRGIIFASADVDFAAAARRETIKLHDAITQCLQPKGS